MDDGLSLLKTHHQEFRRLLKALEDGSEGAVATRERLFVELASLLVVHAGIEEDVLYPELALHAETAEESSHALQEHHLIDVQIDELATLDCAAKTWGEKLHVLGEVLEHHLDEEERDLFPIIPKALGAAKLQEVSEAMHDRLEELNAQMEGELAGHSAQAISIHRRRITD